MNVLVAAVSFSSEMSGVPRHAFRLIRCLLQSPEISQIHLVVAPWQEKLARLSGVTTDRRVKIHRAKMARGSLSRNAWYYLELPKLASRLGADVVHLSYPVPTNAKAFVCPSIVTLHDLYPYEIPENFGRLQAVFNRMILRQCLRGATAIACVSQITRERLKQYLPDATWRKSVRIYNCVEENAVERETPRIPGWNGEPFFLCVAQHRRNKNISVALRAFASLLDGRKIDRTTLMFIVGIRGPESRYLYRLVERLNLREKVCFVEGISDAELQWCYERCSLLLAPSKTEGFGLPVAEAMLAGCRIVCSDIPAFREIGANYCRFVPLAGDSVQALATAMVVELREPKKDRTALQQLSVETLAPQYLDLYREVIASGTVATAAGPPADAYVEVRERHIG